MPGDIWKFSDQIDDFDIAMLRRDFITSQQGMRYYNIGEKPFIRLAREGRKVLLNDADPQGSLTASLGYVEPDELQETLATVLMAVIEEEELLSA